MAFFLSSLATHGFIGILLAISAIANLFTFVLHSLLVSRPNNLALKYAKVDTNYMLSSSSKPNDRG